MQHAPYIEGSIKKHIINMALPAVYALLASFSFILVDTYFISWLGEIQLIAIGYVFPVIALLQMVSVGLGITTSSILSRRLGAGNLNEAREFAVLILATAVVFWLVIIVAGYLTLTSLFSALGATKPVLHYIHAFMTIWYAGLILLFFSFIGSNMLRIIGKAKASGFIRVGGAALNLILSPLLMFTFHMGIAGSALAGVCGRLAGFALIAYLLINAKFLVLTKSLCKRVINKLYYLREIAKICFPSILANIIGPLSMLWMVHLLSKLNQLDVASFGIASRIEEFAVIPLFALSSSIGPIIGQNIGANLKQRARQTLLTSYKWSVIWGLGVAVILLLLGQRLVSIFTHNPTIIHIASFYLALVPFSYASWGLVMMTSANFNSIGKPLKSTLITAIRFIVVFIPLSTLLCFYDGYVGLFTADGVATVCASVFAVVLVKRFWRDKKVVAASE